MPSSGIQVTGLRETTRNLQQAGVALNDMKDAFKRIGDIVSTRSKVLVPRQSGKLASSIRPSRAKNQAKVSAGGVRVKYAGPVHYGWAARKIRPHPFLTTALDQTKPQVISAAEAEIEELVRKANT